MTSIFYSPIKIRSTPRRNCCNRFCLLLVFLLMCCASLASVAYLLRPDITLFEPPYKRRPEVADIQCDRIFKGDILYAKGLPRQVLIPTRPDRLDMSCEAVRKRVLSRRNPPTGFPIAFARVVYSDYEFLEEQLAVSYVDENTFCFALDRKAPLAFRRKFVTLSACLDNVHISSEEYELDSAGRGQTSAHFDCLRNIRKRKWKYVIFQQNHDIVIKTNAEIVEIFKTMGGANDMEMSMCPYDSRCSLHEMNLGRLGLCPKNLREKDREACEKEDITMAKGWAQVSLTRDTVEYLLDQLNTTRLISELHQMYYGMDELFIQSLASTRALRMPGMYPARCLYENNSVAPSNHLFVTRLTHWKWWKAYGCGSNIWRHNICIFGVEDLPYLAGVHHIMVNKLMPDVDYGAISCIGELLYNRTHYALDDHPLDLGIYENLPSVRLHKGMLDDPTYFDRFECPKFPQRKRKPMTQVIGEFLVGRRS